MQDIIQLLPDNVANQIAAGEVVQRPASVVKELLENSIDAGATKVELYVRDAGRNLVQVVDNGTGMSETDARMAFERHATSKIRNTEDIFHITTKGFRGEALASIAAVSQVELKTKTAASQLGTVIYIEGGELQFQEPFSATEGSSFAVKNLFYNVPARRKFLKSNNVEFRHIIDEFQRVALSHENIEFSLHHNDEVVFSLRKGTQLQRIVEIFGRKLHPLLIPIKEDLGWVKLEGYVAKPEGAKKSRGEQFFFVNNRFFRSPYLGRAVQEAFEGLLLPNYSPSFFLYLEMNPDKIDVNIHPQKTEVKFEDENLIFALIRSTIKKSLGIYNVAPSLDFDRDVQTVDKIVGSSSSGSMFHGIQIDRSYNPFATEKPSATEKINLTEMYQAEISAAPSKINLFEEEDFEEDLLRLPNAYWLFNKDGKTLMIDPSRFHQVILQSQKSRAVKEIKSQTLLFSVEYHLNETEKNKYRSVKKYLPGLGFDMELANDNVLRINAAPEGLRESQIVKILEKVFEILDYRSEEDFMEAYQDEWVNVQRKSKYDFLYKTEVEELIKMFTELGFPQYTPAGKVTYLELPLDDFKNKF